LRELKRRGKENSEEKIAGTARVHFPRQPNRRDQHSQTSMQIEVGWAHFSNNGTASDQHENQGSLGTVPSLICTQIKAGHSVVWHEFLCRFLWHNFPDF